MKIIKKYAFIALLFFAVITIVLKMIGFTTYNIETSSMEPEYPINTLIYVLETDFEDLKQGDVITYINPNNSTVTHRITSINMSDRSVKTKGDGNEFEDINAVYEENIVGKVYFKIPYIGKFSSFINQMADKAKNFIDERSEMSNAQNS